MKNLYALLLAFSPLCFAGQEVGNGGDAVVCRYPNGSIKSAELLDIYEARTLRGVENNTSEKNSLEEQIQDLLERLSIISQRRANDYKTEAIRFVANSQILQDVELENIPDSEHVIVKKGCQIEQVAVQREPQFPEDKRYVINKEIWDHFDLINKASLIMHELLYKEALTYRHKNSQQVRYFNSLLLNDDFLTDFQQYTDKEVASFYTLIGFQNAEFKKLGVYSKAFIFRSRIHPDPKREAQSYYKNGSLAKLEFNETATIFMKDINKVVIAAPRKSWQHPDFGSIKFSDTGATHQATLLETKLEWDNFMIIPKRCQKLESDSGEDQCKFKNSEGAQVRETFDREGKVSEIQTGPFDDSKIYFPHNFVFSTNSQYQFESHIFETCKIKEHLCTSLDGFNDIDFKLNENGKVVSACMTYRNVKIGVQGFINIDNGCFNSYTDVNAVKSFTYKLRPAAKRRQRKRQKRLTLLTANGGKITIPFGKWTLHFDRDGFLKSYTEVNEN